MPSTPALYLADGTPKGTVNVVVQTRALFSDPHGADSKVTYRSLSILMRSTAREGDSVDISCRQLPSRASPLRGIAKTSIANKNHDFVNSVDIQFVLPFRERSTL